MENRTFTPQVSMTPEFRNTCRVFPASN